MIILEKPYVSDFLIETIKKNNYSVLDNEVSREFFSQEFLISEEEAIEICKEELVYSNSENSLNWISDKLCGTDIDRMITLSKDKVAFRKAIKSIFPNYYFKEVLYSDLKKISLEKLKFPLVLKPSVGFLSYGVFSVQDEKEWKSVLLKLDEEIEKIKGVFPASVVDTSSFIVEEMISGEEFAIDAYFDEKSEATILNIFKHPFFDGKDVSDRVYFTSKQVIQEHLIVFKNLLDKIGKIVGYKNFPFHLELRYDGNVAVPIEINPLRFCGWCITDIAQYAWGINVYEAFLNQEKPDWDEILSKRGEEFYYFTIGDIPNSMSKADILAVDYERYLKNISETLALRKIDYKNNPIFAIVFAKTNDVNEIKSLLSLDMANYICRKC